MKHDGKILLLTVCGIILVGATAIFLHDMGNFHANTQITTVSCQMDLVMGLIYACHGSYYVQTINSTLEGKDVFRISSLSYDYYVNQSTVGLDHPVPVESVRYISSIHIKGDITETIQLGQSIIIHWKQIQFFDQVYDRNTGYALVRSQFKPNSHFDIVSASINGIKVPITYSCNLWNC